MSKDLDAESLAAGTSTMFVTCTVSLEPGRVVTYDPAAWRDALVFVTAGEIELECISGATQLFRRGAILCLQRLPLRVLRNRGAVDARIVTLRRRASWGAELTG